MRNMHEIVIISGKGGTGKTSLTAAFAALAENAVLADCDVDASDLHLVLSPSGTAAEPFRSGRKALINKETCVSCGACLAHCRFGAVRMSGSCAGEASFKIDELSCEGCGTCVAFCPVKAVEFPEKDCGKLYVSKTRFGPMAHAELRPGSGNSGKLASKVRAKARELADKAGSELIIVDGPPGIGCPVIASISGATFLVVVTEPTPSGAHDMGRVLKLAEHFGVCAAVCVNKADVNPDKTAEIIGSLRNSQSVAFSCMVPYDTRVTDAQLQGKAVVEIAKDGAAREIAGLWDKICSHLELSSRKGAQN